MIYKIRVILNAKEDVIRDIAISKFVTLEDLHNVISNSFGFIGDKMASFYRSDQEWEQGEEFPLFDMSEGLNSIVQMQNITVDQVLENNHDKMIYIYDFFTMWSFYVELIDRDFEHNNMKLPSLLISLGEVPNNAPDIKFESEDQTNENFSDEFIVSSEEDYEDFSNN